MNRADGKYIPSDDPRTLAGFRRRRWNLLNGRTVNGYKAANNTNIKNLQYINKGIELRITKDEFYEWCNAQWDLIDSIYKSGEKPTIDRINSNGHYELSNMRIISMSENLARRKWRKKTA